MCGLRTGLGALDELEREVPGLLEAAHLARVRDALHERGHELLASLEEPELAFASRVALGLGVALEELARPHLLEHLLETSTLVEESPSDERHDGRVVRLEALGRGAQCLERDLAPGVGLGGFAGRQRAVGDGCAHDLHVEVVAADPGEHEDLGERRFGLQAEVLGDAAAQDEDREPAGLRALQAPEVVGARLEDLGVDVDVELVLDLACLCHGPELDRVQER